MDPGAAFCEFGPVPCSSLFSPLLSVLSSLHFLCFLTDSFIMSNPIILLYHIILLLPFIYSRTLSLFPSTLYSSIL